MGIPTPIKPHIIVQTTAKVVYQRPVQAMCDGVETSSNVGQIVIKSYQLLTETVLHTVSKFQADHACFQGKASANFDGNAE